MTYKCKKCGSEWWKWMLLKGKCSDCGEEVYPMGGDRIEKSKQSPSCNAKK